MRVSFPIMALCVLAGGAAIAEIARAAVQPQDGSVSAERHLQIGTSEEPRRRARG